MRPPAPPDFVAAGEEKGCAADVGKRDGQRQATRFLCHRRRRTATVRGASGLAGNVGPISKLAATNIAGDGGGTATLKMDRHG